MRVTKYRQAFEEWRLNYLRSALEQCEGNVSKAAKYCGVHRAQFYKMRLRSAHGPRHGNQEWMALQ